jgi:alkanesulfonate monooxygenase SsuD/methylene tetrahydromethanopterin reductase-like flavin-dependent oxidoreductase (luciferase family)
MPIELRSWINPQSYSNYSTAGIAREAAYFTPVPEPVTADPDYISSEARKYEAAGYDSSILPQSATWPDVTVTAAWALAHTSRLRVVLAHRPGTQVPTAAARALATLDRVSDGRTGLHLILGSGADLPRDGDLADRSARYRRAAEYLEIFTGVLTRDEPLDFEGEFYQVRGAFSGVKPVQSPRPVISLPAGSDEGVALAARYGDVVAFHAMSLAAAAEKIAAVRALSSAQERPSPPPVLDQPDMLAGETDDAAYRHLRELEQAIRRLLEFRSSGSAVPGSVLSAKIGSPTWRWPKISGRTACCTWVSAPCRDRPRRSSDRRRPSRTLFSPTTISGSGS